MNVTADEVTYSLRNGGGSARLQLMHHGKEVEVTQVKPVTVPIPPAHADRSGAGAAGRAGPGAPRHQRLSAQSDRRPRSSNGTGAVSCVRL